MKGLRSVIDCFALNDCFAFEDNIKVVISLNRRLLFQ